MIRLLLCFFVLVLPLWAEEQNLQLVKLRADVEQLQSELATLVDNAARVSTELKKIEAELNKQAKTIKDVEASLADLEVKRRALDQRVARDSVDLKQKLKLSEARLRVGYMYRTDDLLLRAVLGGAQDAARIGYLISLVRKNDQIQIVELTAAQAKLAASRTELMQAKEQVNAKAQRLKSEQERRALELKRRSEESQKLIAARKAMEKTIAGLQAQASRLENAVQEVLVPVVSNGTIRSRKPFTGKGLNNYRGQLYAPVSGKVVKLSGDSFDAAVLKKGVAFLAPPGVTVRACAPGKVVYIGKLPGYEQVVIVDHGSRSHTLYGRLSSVSVALDDEVDFGDELGVVGSNQSANFYFEVRQAGAPLSVKKVFGKVIPGL